MLSLVWISAVTNSDICIHKEGLTRVNHAHESACELFRSTCTLNKIKIKLPLKLLFFFSLTGSIFFLPEVKQSRLFSCSSAFEIDEKGINSILTVHSPRSNQSFGYKKTNRLSNSYTLSDITQSTYFRLIVLQKPSHGFLISASFLVIVDTWGEKGICRILINYS